MERARAGSAGFADAIRSPSPSLKIVVAFLAVVLGLLSVTVYALQYRTTDRFTKDFALDYVSAKAVIDGRDPYTPIHDLVRDYLHPPARILNDVLPGANWHTPFKLLLTLPLALLPYQAAGVVWLLLSSAAYIAAAMLFAKGLGWRRSTGVVIGIGSLIVPVVQKDLSTGNLNGELLLLLVAAWYLARQGRDAWAGASIGLAVALKVFPGLMLIPFVVARRWRAVRAAVVSAVGLTAVGLLGLGPSKAIGYVKAGAGSQGFKYWDASPANVGWWGMATRWLSPNGWVPHANLETLALAIASAGVIVFLVLAVRPRAGLCRDEFWSTAPLMLLVWPIVWDHYLVLVLPWVVLALQNSARKDRSTLVVASLIAVPLFIGLLPGGPSLAEIEPWRAATIFQLPAIALIAAVVMDRRAPSTATPVTKAMGVPEIRAAS